MKINWICGTEHTEQKELVINLVSMNLHIDQALSWIHSAGIEMSEQEFDAVCELFDVQMERDCKVA